MWEKQAHICLHSAVWAVLGWRVIGGSAEQTRLQVHPEECSWRTTTCSFPSASWVVFLCVLSQKPCCAGSGCCAGFSCLCITEDTILCFISLFSNLPLPQAEGDSCQWDVPIGACHWLESRPVSDVFAFTCLCHCLADLVVDAIVTW